MIGKYVNEGRNVQSSKGQNAFRIMCRLSELFERGTRHFRDADMEAAAYPFELPRREEVIGHIDLAQSGVGGNNSWGATPLPDYLLPVADFVYRFHLQPAKVAEQELPGLGRSLVSVARSFETRLPKLTAPPKPRSQKP